MTHPLSKAKNFVKFLRKLEDDMTVDDFFYVQSLNIGQEISPITLQIQNGSVFSEKDPADPIIYFTFPSADYSHPHLVYLYDGKISFIQMAIPISEQELYRNTLEEMGEPEIILPKVKSEIMLGYPGKGMAFIYNGYNSQIMRVQKFPVKTAQEFATQEGKNFHPVTVSPGLFSTESTSISATPSAQSAFNKMLQIPILKDVFLLLIVSLVLLAFGKWYQSKFRRVKSN